MNSMIHIYSIYVVLPWGANLISASPLSNSFMRQSCCRSTLWKKMKQGFNKPHGFHHVSASASCGICLHSFSFGRIASHNLSGQSPEISRNPTHLWRSDSKIGAYWPTVRKSGRIQSKPIQFSKAIVTFLPSTSSPRQHSAWVQQLYGLPQESMAWMGLTQTTGDKCRWELPRTATASSNQRVFGLLSCTAFGTIEIKLWVMRCSHSAWSFLLS